MFTNVMGGYNVKERLRCIEELKSFDSAGYVIDGFHSNGVSAANMNWEEVEPVLKSTLVFLLYNIYIARYYLTNICFHRARFQTIVHVCFMGL